MRILIVHNSYQQPGGEDVVFHQEVQLLRRMGHSVAIYHRSNNEIEGLNPLQRMALLPTAIWARSSRREFSALLCKEKPDVVHIHNTFVVISPSIFAACTDAGVPMVQTLHNYRLLCPAAILFRNGHVCEECLEHTLLRSVKHGCYHQSRPVTAAVALMLATHRQLGTIVNSVDRFIALTHFSRHKFIQGGIPPEKITVKPNFVDPDPCTRTQRGEYALFVGRLSPEKRVSTLLLAWQKLRSQIPLLIIGGGPLQTELLGLAQRLGLSNVHIQGALPRQETLEAMNRARFLLFCSEWYENFPCTLAEAFACRTPVITSRLGAMEEIVEDGRTGLHFTAGDADDLAEKVDWAWRHPGQMSEIGEQARREYETKYTADQNYAMLMEIYRHAMRSGPAPIEVQEPMSIPG